MIGSPITQKTFSQFICLYQFAKVRGVSLICIVDSSGCLAPSFPADCVIILFVKRPLQEVGPALTSHVIYEWVSYTKPRNGSRRINKHHSPPRLGPNPLAHTCSKLSSSSCGPCALEPWHGHPTNLICRLRAKRRLPHHGDRHSRLVRPDTTDTWN